MSSADILVLVLALAALAIAVPRIARWARAPRLRLAAHGGTGVPVRVEGKHARCWTVRVENVGAAPVRRCRATLDGLEYRDGDRWRPHPGFPYSIPLRWMGEGLTPSMDLQPSGPPQELAVCVTYEGASKLQLASAVQVASGLLLDYPAGVYRLRAAVMGGDDEEVRAVRRFVVEFDGDWEGVRIRAAD